MGWSAGTRRWRRAAAVALLAGTSGLAGCGLVGQGTFHADVPDVITVTSPDVSPKAVIGAAFTCYGRREFPGFHWSGAPTKATKSFAVILDDKAAPITPYIYWILFNISAQRTAIQPGEIPPGARQAHNSKGLIGYDAPCPTNAPHSYRLTVYALSRTLNLKSGAGLKATWTAIAQAAIARGTLYITANP